MGLVRVGIIEDDAFVVDTLAGLIERTEGFEVVGARADAAGLHDLAAAHFPDVLLVDVRLGSTDGIEAVADARRRGLRSKVVFMTAHPSRQVVRSALEVGLEGFLDKGDVNRHWRLAVESAMEGGVFFSPSIGAWIARHEADLDRFAERRRFQDAFAQLSPLEQRVLAMLPSGASVPEMARELRFGQTTVKSAIATIVGRLGVENRSQASALHSRHHA